MTVKTFKDLIVWQKSHALVLKVYRVTERFPGIEQFGLVSQIRRSSSSIATNIVEGHKRKSRKEFLHFLNMAESSLEETKYHILLSKDLGYLKEESYNELSKICDEVGKLLYSFQRSLS